MKKQILKTAVLLSLLPLSACSPVSDEDSGKLNVYASCYPVYDFVKQIGGDLINAHLLPAPGLEPHEYEPTSRDLTKLLSSKVFFANGLGMEKWLDNLKGNMVSSEFKSLQEKTNFLGESLGDKVEKVEGVVDPHAWLNPLHVKKYMETISTVLSSLDPDNASVYEKNLFDASKKVDELDGYITAQTSLIENRKLVVSHAAFGYFGNRYGFEQIYLTGLASEEPTVRDVERIIDSIKENNIKTIYAEELDGSDALDRIQEETGCDVKLLHTFETLTEQEIKEGEDYFSIMKQNIATLKEGSSK